MNMTTFLILRIIFSVFYKLCIVLFLGVVRKQSSISKNTTKKQQASVNFRKQQESASEPTLPKLVKSKDPPHKKKKGRKLKSKLPNQFDDYSDGGKSSKNNKMKK